MITTDIIDIDLAKPGAMHVVNAVQNDKYSRNVVANLYLNGSKFLIPDGTTVVASYNKPDGTGGIYDSMPDGSIAWNIDGNSVTVALAPQVLTAAGMVNFSITLIQGKFEISVFSISINVHPLPSFTAQSEDYVNMRDWLSAELNKALEEAKASGEFKGDPGTSVTVSSITESTEDGGSNVVTFSDGKTLTVKNGRAGGDGYSPVKYTDYWTDEEQASMAQDAVNTLSATVGIVNPDKFSGTDSQKLQAAFDALSTSGGVISINRIYTLTSDVIISHDSSANNNLIVVKGDGQVPRIDFGSYCFRGTAGKHSCGGVIFKDMRLTGEGIGFDGTTLIRLTFENCMIRRFTNFIYSSDYAQSIYFMGCYIRGSLDATIKTIYTPDLKIIGCVCESGSCLINVSGSMDGCSITDCCIEGYNNTPIILPEKCCAVNISNNYFETNRGVNIDATATIADASLSITNNLFTEYQGEDETIGAIALPPVISAGVMIVSGNRCAYSISILLKVPDNATDLSKVYAFGNYGTTNNPDKVKMLMPADIQKAVKGIVKGVDYWTPADKEEMVHNVLEEMSGETWQFELSDGTTFERTVATASLTEFDSEAWTFTLADGSTISKEVSIV